MEIVRRTARLLASVTSETEALLCAHLAADIIDEGITMTGGGSRLPENASVLADETGLPVRVADEALTCVAMGAGRYRVSVARAPATA